MNRGDVQVFPSIQGRCSVPPISVPAIPGVSDAPSSAGFFSCMVSYLFVESL